MNCPYCGVEMNTRGQFSLTEPKPKGVPRKQWTREYGRINLQAATKDHVRPQSRGGKETILVCYGCNQDKGNLTLSEWRAVLSLRYRTFCVFWFERQALKAWLILNVYQPAWVLLSCL